MLIKRIATDFEFGYFGNKIIGIARNKSSAIMVY